MLRMSSTEVNKRITFKRTRPNPLFQEWLEELQEDAQAKKSKLEPMLKEALDSLSKYPLPLQSGAECAILKGFDKKLCTFLDKRLDVYKFNKSLIEEVGTNEEVSSETGSTSETNGILEPTSLPIVSLQKLNSEEINAVVKKANGSSSSLNSSSGSQSNNTPHPSTSRDTNSSGQLVTVPKKPNSKAYKPSFRSGSYAILVALYEHFRDNPDKPLSKDDLIEKAQPHSEESFIRPKPGTFYTAWSSMGNLITKRLVQKSRHKKDIKYTLTNKGKLLADELLKESANIPTLNDIIFGNGNVHTITEKPSGSNSKDQARQESITVANGKKNMATLQEGEGNNGHENRARDIMNSPKKYIELKAGSFDIVLLIDKNEASGFNKKHDPTVAEFNKYSNLKHEYRSLKIGDFAWVARDSQNNDIELVIPYVVERKRMDDFGHSVKDGRFHEQKFRLRKCGLNNVIYLVENYGNNRHVGMPLQTLMQGLANTRLQDGFKVHTTKGFSNTVRFLAMMTKRLTIEYKYKNLKGCAEEPHGDTLMTFDYFNSSSRKSKPLTVTETFIKLILQLKGVSVEKALAITKEYSTPSLLIKKYKECNQQTGEFLLANLKYGETNRSVGPAVSKALYQLFSDEL